MKRCKTATMSSIANGVESLDSVLTGKQGKARTVVAITGTFDAGIFLRLYRDQDLIAEIECALLPVESPWLPVDVEIRNGEQAKIGFSNVSAGSVTPTYALIYTENDN